MTPLFNLIGLLYKSNLEISEDPKKDKEHSLSHKQISCPSSIKKKEVPRYKMHYPPPIQIPGKTLPDKEPSECSFLPNLSNTNIYKLYCTFTEITKRFKI